MKKTASGIGYTYMIFEVGTNPKYKKIMSAIFTFTLHTKSVNLLYYLCAFYNIYPQCEIFNIFLSIKDLCMPFSVKELEQLFIGMKKKSYKILFHVDDQPFF